MLRRKTLISEVERVAPALSSKTFVPALRCFNFEDGHVVAYDDIIAIRVPCTFPIDGCLPGALMLNMLKASKAKEVVVSKKDAGVLLVLGCSRVNMPLLTTADFPFKPPADLESEACELAIDAKIRNALEQASISLGTDPSAQSRLGITISFGGARIAFYSTDGATITRVFVDAVPPKVLQRSAIILPPRFCEMLVGQSSANPITKLFISKSLVEARSKDGLQIFGRVVEGANTKQFEDIFKANITDTGLVAIPPTLKHALKRATILVDMAGADLSRFTIKDGHLHIYTSSPAGEVDDKMTLQGDDIAKTSPVECVAKRILRALTLGKKMSFGKVVRISGPGVEHLIVAVMV